jgi:hypothetical protein
LFENICIKNNIKFQKIYRAALNVWTFDEEKIGPLHVDHKFPHKIFLMYLNNFSDGSTYIENNETKKITEIKAEKFKVVVFNGESHAVGSCKNRERRAVLIVSFN